MQLSYYYPYSFTLSIIGNGLWALVIPILAIISFVIHLLLFVVAICCNFAGADKEQHSCCCISFTTFLAWLSFISLFLSSIFFWRDIEHLKEKEDEMNEDFTTEICVVAAKFVLSLTISGIDCCLKKKLRKYKETSNQKHYP